MENAQGSSSTTKESQENENGKVKGNQPITSTSKNSKKNRRNKENAGTKPGPSGSSARHSAQVLLETPSVREVKRLKDLKQQAEAQKKLKSPHSMDTSLDKEYKGALEKIRALEKENGELSAELETEKIYRSCNDEELAQKLKLAEDEIKKLEKEKTELNNYLNRSLRKLNGKENEGQEKAEIWQDINTKLLKLENLEEKNREQSSHIGQLEREKLRMPE